MHLKTMDNLDIHVYAGYIGYESFFASCKYPRIK